MTQEENDQPKDGVTKETWNSSSSGSRHNIHIKTSQEEKSIEVDVNTDIKKEVISEKFEDPSS